MFPMKATPFAHLAVAILFALNFGACGVAAQQVDNEPKVDKERQDWRVVNPIGAYSPLLIEKADGERIELSVETRDDMPGRGMGMMYRTELDDDKGMIFVFQRPARQGFWMKNTLISLDMVFVRANGKIANILHNVPPLTLNSRRSQGRVLAVLELRGGRATELGLQTGDLVRHSGLGNIAAD